MSRELAQVVVMGGDVYGPGYINPPPDDIAKRITNAAAWGESKSDTDDGSPQGEEVVETPVVAAPGDGEVTTPTAPEPTPETPADKAEEDEVEAPPRSGKGSGITAWRAFADAKGVSYSEDAERDEIIQACEQAGVI